MIAKLFPFDCLRLFAADGQVYRAFDHLIAARSGALMMIPSHRVDRCCEAVTEGCPVPDEEVYAALEYPNRNPIHALRPWMQETNLIGRLGYLGFDLSEFDIDRIAPMVNGEESVLRLVHPCGLRYAVVMS